MAEPHVLAVDLGTSGCKVALVSARGKVSAWAFHPVDTLLFPGGGAEQRPDDWWSTFLSASKEALAAAPELRESIVAVCCSTQGEGTVAVDAKGKALGNAILWMDARGAEYLKSITRGFINVAGYAPWKVWRWIRLTGGAPSLTGKDPASHMLYIKHVLPDIYKATAKFLNVLDYMNLCLTGRCVASSDSILTSWVTDNRNPDNIVYHDGLVKGSGIERDKFPDIVKCSDVIGELKADVAAELGLKSGVKVVAGAIDTPAAAVGSGAVEDYAAHLYLGTSSWLAAHVPFKKTDIISSMASVPCAVPGHYLLTALQATAGGNLTFLRDRILYHKDELLREEAAPDVYKIMDRIAAKTPAGSHGVIYAPWIYGERAPVEDRLVRAAIINISLENSREDIIRAMLEGIALNTRWLLDYFERFMGRKTDAIRAVGGGANSIVWCQIFADVMDRPVWKMADPIQANVRGAALIAAAGLGLIKFAEIPKFVECDTVCTPNPEHRAIYDKHFRELIAYYKQTKPIYHRLNG
jgi:xylulokinase